MRNVDIFKAKIKDLSDRALEAKRKSASAEAEFEAIKAEILAFSNITNVTELESDAASVTVYNTGGRNNLSADLVAAKLSEADLAACYVRSEGKLAVRITAK